MRLLVFNLATDADDPVLGFTTRWIRALAGRAEAVHVITMRAGRVDLPENVRVYSVGKERGWGEPRRAAAFYRHLWGILARERIDVCFSHMIPVFTVLAAPLLRARGIPVVTWYAHRQVTPLLKVAHRLSDRMVTISESSYRYRWDKVTVLGHGVDTELFSPGGVEPEEPPLLLSVGRLSPIKDLATLVDAVGRLRESGCHVRAALLGAPLPRDAAYVDSVRERIVESGLGDAVAMPGAVPDVEVPGWLHRSALHVNLTPTGAFDKAVLEALACGRLSLASNQGFAELFGRWSDRLLFEHGNAADLARKIEGVLELPADQREAMVAELRSRVLEQHGLGGLADRLYAVLADVIGSGPTRRAPAAGLPELT